MALQLLKKPTVLQLNDVIHEVDRFNKENYSVFKIIAIDVEMDSMVLEVVKSGGRRPHHIGYKCMSMPSCHYGHRNTRWLTYFSPTCRVLYGT